MTRAAPHLTLNAIRLALTPLAHQRRDIDRLWKAFGKQVRIQRKERKISLTLFAKKLRLTPTMVSFLEAGCRQWTVKRAQKAVSILNRSGGWPETAKR